MNRARSYYDLFGVSPTASPREIRSAYLKLVKRHHPDSQCAAGDAAAGILQTINRCYGVLKDPAKRAAYDASLARSALSEAPLQRLQDVRRRRMPRSFSAGVILLGMLIALLPLIPKSYEEEVSAWLFARPAAQDTSHGKNLPTVAQSRDVVRLALSVPSREAVRISQQCFRHARKAADAAAAQLCVIFDEAALYAQGISRAGSESLPYFTHDVVRSRQGATLADFEMSPPHSRLDELREVAFAAVMDEYRPKGPAAGVHAQ